MPIDPNLEYQKALARGASIKQAESVRKAASASAIREESDQRRRDQENDRKIREAESRANVQRRRDSQSEKYERDRERTLHEQAAQRAKADYQELPRYDLRANDAAAAVEAELEELDRQEELEKSSTQFYAKIFVLMTRHKDSQEQLFVALRDFFETTFDVSNSFSPLFSEPDYVLNRFSQDILNRNKEALVYAECLELFEEYVAKRKKKEMAEREEYIRQNKENADAYIRQCEEEAVKSLAKRAEEAKLIADREAVQAETSAKDLRYQLILLASLACFMPGMFVSVDIYKFWQETGYVHFYANLRWVYLSIAGIALGLIVLRFRKSR